MNIKTLLLAGGMIATMLFAVNAADSPRKVPADAGKSYAATPVKKATTRAIEEETWKAIGVGQLRDNLVDAWYYIDDWYQMDVQIEESEQTPGRYRVLNPYHNYPVNFGAGAPVKQAYMIVDASDPDHCYIEQTETHLLLGTLDNTGKNAQLAIWSIADDYYNNRFGNWDQADEEGVAGKLKNGCITFRPLALLSTVVEDENPNWDTLWKQSNGAGMFRLRLPDAPKTDIVLSFVGKDGNDLLYNLATEEDVDYILAALVPGKYDAAFTQDIIDGAIASVKVENDGAFAVPYAGDGVYTLVAIPFSNGKAIDPVCLTRELSFSEDVWRKCGSCLFGEGILSSNEMRAYGFVYDYEEYLVDVEESVENPGLIRLVDPYGLAYSCSSAGNYDCERHYYMEIDATAKNKVFMNKMEPIGLDLGYGRMVIWSRAAREIEKGFSKLDVNDSLFGHHVENKITFPKDAMLLQFPDVRDDWYWANEKGQMSVTFSDENNIIGGEDNVGVETVIADSDKAGEWFTINGLRLEKAPAETGLYIYRKGKLSTKVRL